MIFDDNYYTSILAEAVSIAASGSDTSAQVTFLVGDNMIFGDILGNDDPRLKKTKIETGDSILFSAASHVLSNRDKLIKERFSADEMKNLEPVYIYLENVTIHSTSSNKSIHVQNFALRITSIDGIFSGSTESLLK